MVDDGDEAPRLVRRSVFSRAPKLCINCLAPLKKGSSLGGWLIPQDYVCPRCGYKGYAYVEPQASEEERTKSE